MKEVLQLQGIYSVSIVALEIPSGYFADLWGKKRTLIIGSILGVLGFSIYCFSYSFWGFLLAELILGIGQSFISGSDSALLYDSLNLMGRKNDYVKMEGRVLSIGNFAETLAAIVGGYLAEYSLRTPFIAQTFIALIAVPAALGLKETSQTTSIKNRWKSIISVVKNSLYENKRLRLMIVFTAFIGTATLSMAWFIQAFLNTELHLSYSQIGITLAVLNLIVGLSTLISYKVEQRWSSKSILIFIVLGIVGGYFSMSFIHHYLVLIPIAFFYFTRGIATPVLKNDINKMTQTEVRATILSIRNFTIRIIFALVGPFLGWYSDTFSITEALGLAGLIILTGASICLFLFLRIPEKKH